MRILFLAHRLPYPPNKGDKVRSFWELRDLSARHEVDLLCFYDDPEDTKSFDLVRRFCRHLYAEPISPWRSRLRAFRALLRGKAFTPSYFCSRSMGERVRAALRARDYDAVFVFSSSMAQYVCEQGLPPCFLDMVDVDSDKWAQFALRRPGLSSWLWGREAVRLARLESQLLEQFHTTLVCTEAEAELLRRRRADGRIEVVEHALDTDYFDPTKVSMSPSIEALRPYLIFTGSMDYLPNVDAVIHFYEAVFPQVVASVPEARFVIAGRKPARAVRNLRKDPRVVVTGTVPDVRRYLRGAHAAVAPLRIARGVQTKILEAMAMGLPVVASRKAASALPGDLVRHLRVEDDPQAMAQAFVELLQQPSTVPRASVRDAAVAHFEAVNQSLRIERILNDAIKNRHQTDARAGVTVEIASSLYKSVSAGGK